MSRISFDRTFRPTVRERAIIAALIEGTPIEHVRLSRRDTPGRTPSATHVYARWTDAGGRTFVFSATDVVSAVEGLVEYTRGWRVA